MKKSTKHEIGNFLYGIGFVLLVWLIWDVWHIGNASDIGAAIELGIFKFFAAAICMGVGSIIQQETSQK